MWCQTGIRYWISFQTLRHKVCFVCQQIFLSLHIPFSIIFFLFCSNKNNSIPMCGRSRRVCFYLTKIADKTVAVSSVLGLRQLFAVRCLVALYRTCSHGQQSRQLLFSRYRLNIYKLGEQTRSWPKKINNCKTSERDSLHNSTVTFISVHQANTIFWMYKSKQQPVICFWSLVFDCNFSISKKWNCTWIENCVL